MLIRGLTLHQPWAWAIAQAGKRIENRSWRPPAAMMGQWLAIHGGKTWDAVGARFIAEQTGQLWHKELLKEASVHGAIVAVAQLVFVVTASDDPWFFGPYGWVLADVHVLERPIYCRGKQGLWVLEHDTEQWLLGIVQGGFSQGGGK